MRCRRATPNGAPSSMARYEPGRLWKGTPAVRSLVHSNRRLASSRARARPACPAGSPSARDGWLLLSSRLTEQGPSTAPVEASSARTVDVTVVRCESGYQYLIHCRRAAGSRIPAASTRLVRRSRTTSLRAAATSGPRCLRPVRGMERRVAALLAGTTTSSHQLHRSRGCRARLVGEAIGRDWSYLKSRVPASARHWARFAGDTGARSR